MQPFWVDVGLGVVGLGVGGCVVVGDGDGVTVGLVLLLAVVLGLAVALGVLVALALAVGLMLGLPVGLTLGDGAATSPVSVHWKTYVPLAPGVRSPQETPGCGATTTCWALGAAANAPDTPSTA